VASCSEMQVGEIYACPECGLEARIVKACGDSDHEKLRPRPVQAHVLRSSSSS